MRYATGPAGTILARASALLLGASLGPAMMSPAAWAGPALNQFEMKDLEVEQGAMQFQSQNAFSIGQPKRRLEVEPDGVVFDDNTVLRQRHALELEAHLTSFFRSRVGIEFEKERLDDPGAPVLANAYDALKLTSAAVEGVLVLVPVKGDGIGLGLMTEYDHALSKKEADTWFVGPIVQAQHGPWRITANLLAVKFLAPAEDGVRDNKWDFAYATQLRYRLDEAWSFAVEAYGTIDRLPGTGVPDEAERLFGTHDLHRVGPVVYYTHSLGGLSARKSGGGGKAVGVDDEPGRGRGKPAGKDDDDEPKAILGVGLLAGVSPATPDLTLKWSLEVEW